MNIMVTKIKILIIFKARIKLHLYQKYPHQYYNNQHQCPPRNQPYSQQQLIIIVGTRRTMQIDDTQQPSNSTICNRIVFTSIAVNRIFLSQIKSNQKLYSGLDDSNCTTPTLVDTFSAVPAA